MDKVKIGDDFNIYTIPLNSIDLKYLTKYIQNPNEDIKLWSDTCLNGEDEYFRVKITQNDNTSHECIEPSDTYKCNICNTDVPTTSFNEHNESTKHVTMKKIFKKVLERLTKHLNDDNIQNNHKPLQDQYYCIPCSKVIQNKNKSKHLNSAYHRNSQRKLNIIETFYKILNNEDDIENGEEIDLNVNETKFDIKITKSSDIEASIDEFEDSNNSDLESENNSERINTKTDSDNNNNENKSPIFKDSLIQYALNKTSIDNSNNINEELTFEEYTKKMKIKHNLKENFPQAEKNSVILCSRNGEKIQVPHEHFHSFRIFNNHYCCQVCDERITENSKEHEESEEHVKNILQPFNEHFSRPIDPTFSHCIACNIVTVNDTDYHSTNANHLKTIKESKRIEKKNSKPQNKILCQTCDIYIENSLYLTHTQGKTHINKINDFMEKNKIKNVNSDNYYCSICKVTFLRASLKPHVTSVPHQTNLNEEFCVICRVYVPKGGMDEHLAGKPHKTKTEEKVKTIDRPKASPKRSPKKSIPDKVTSDAFKKSNVDIDIDKKELDEYCEFLEFADNKTKVVCKLCVVSIPAQKFNIVQHMIGKSHIENENNKKLECFNKLLLTDGANVKCEICDVNMPFVQKTIIEHMDGNKHKKTENEFLKFHKISDQKFSFFCQCCHLYTLNFLDHINSKLHIETIQEKYAFDKDLLKLYIYEDKAVNPLALVYRKLYEKLLMYNEIFTEDGGTFRCAICRIQLNKISEIDHVLGASHRSLKLKLRRTRLH